jgi:chorismate mutase
MWCRGIRGATLVSANTRENILAATQELLQGMIEQNHLKKEQVACVFFTTTPDLDAEFPALAARQLGWRDVALLCSQEIDVPHSLPRCLRILILFNTEKRADEIIHLYIKGAEVLRQEQERQGEES